HCHSCGCPETGCADASRRGGTSRVGMPRAPRRGPIRPARVTVMTSETVDYVALDEGVLRIVIATAAHGTSMDFTGIDAGAAALRDRDPAVGAVLLTGTGANFCAGGDVRGFAAAAERGAHIRDLATRLHDFVRALDAAPVPVVAGVQGWAAGAGVSLVLAADVALGAATTK